LSPVGDGGGDEAVADGGAVSTAGAGDDEMSFGWLAVSSGAAASFLGAVVYLVWSLMGHGR